MKQSRSIFGSASLILLGLLLSNGAGADPVQLFTDEALSHSTAMRQLAEFPEPLSEDELARCLRFLQAHYDRTEYPLLIVRQNDLADKLLQSPSTVDSALTVLLSVLEDLDAELLWQEYCLQKLALAYEQSALSEDMRAHLLEVLRQQAGNTQTSFSGTALLGLYRVREQAGLLPDELIEMARYILKHSDYAVANKVTALQLAVLLGDRTALEQARQWMADPALTVQLRVSAIAAIGSAGSAQDATQLEALLKHPDLRLRRASQTALKKLQVQ